MTLGEFQQHMLAHRDLIEGVGILSIRDAIAVIAQRVGFRHIRGDELLSEVLDDLWEFVKKTRPSQSEMR